MSPMKDLLAHLLRVAVALDLLRILEDLLVLQVDHSVHLKDPSEDFTEVASPEGSMVVVSLVATRLAASQVAMGVEGAEAVDKN